MPGLVGIFPHCKEDNAALEKMIKSITHEDWYGLDFFNEGGLGCARVHLGFYNPEKQPIFNESRELLIFMDGKIYDYNTEYVIGDQKIKIQNDAEFCLRSYETHGESFVSTLNGAFNLVICDIKQKKILIANDRYGLRPLYFTFRDKKLLFGPEIKSLLQYSTITRELNMEAVADFFAFGKLLGDKTFFCGINVFPPATILTYDGEKVNIKKYWDFSYEANRTTPEKKLRSDLIRAFKKAVNDRVTSNRNCRVGVALSGGLDSRIIVGAVEPNNRSNLVACTYGPSWCNEIKIAKKVARKSNIEHLVIEYNPEDLLPYASEVVFFSDGMDTMGVCDLPYTSRKAREHIDILFNGLAGDLLLGGSFIDKEIVSAKDSDDVINIILNKERMFSDEEFNKLFNRKTLEKVREFPKKSVLEVLPKHYKNPADMHDSFSLKNHVRRFTIMGDVIERMQLEVGASPMFDNRVMDIIMRIPPELRMKYRFYAKFIKELCPELSRIPYNKTMIPPSYPRVFWNVFYKYQLNKERLKKLIWIATRGKVFLRNKSQYSNFDEWVRTNKIWRDFLEKKLLDKNARYTEYLDQEYVRHLINQVDTALSSKCSRKLIYILSFELFLESFFPSGDAQYDTTRTP